MPFKKKEVIRMAKSNLAVVESGAEQAVVEPEAGIDSQSAPKIPAAPGSAIFAHEGGCCRSSSLKGTWYSLLEKF